MDVFLVNARLRELTRHAAKMPPLGLAYIAAVLHSRGYEVAAIDLNVTPFEQQQILNTIKDLSPQIVAISANTPTYKSGLNFARLAKMVNPLIKVVFGGAHASVLHKEVISEEAVDVVVRGEGENTMAELTDCWIKNKGSLAQIKGITYKENGAVMVNQNRSPILNPDSLPFPVTDLFPFEMYGMPNAVLASRGGCPFSCYFCAVNSIWHGKRRLREPRAIVTEIARVITTHSLPKTRAINFSDDALTLNKEHSLLLCKYLKQLAEKIPVKWRCNTRVDLVDSQLLKEMREAGCYSIEYGIEAGSQEIMNSIGKNITLARVKKVVEMTVTLGIDAECSFMFPHPEDTEKTINKQIEFMKELYNMGASETLSLTTPLPGSKLYSNLNQLGIELLSDDWDDYDCRHIIISTKNLSREKIQEQYRKMVQSLGMQDSN
ncbi:MAG: radical SAM protein [Dehalococcoidales bacterium]|nr:radical SAM protein [Dehalococcoidales bacterium]